MKHLRDLMLLGFALSVPAAVLAAWASQTPTPTPTSMEAADMLAGAALPWACSLNILAVLLGLYLLLGRSAPAMSGNAIEEERPSTDYLREAGTWE
jgi:hypothetical protein